MNDFLCSLPFTAIPFQTFSLPTVKVAPVIIPLPELDRLDPESFTYLARVAMIMRQTNVTEVAAAIGRSRVVTSQAINHGLHSPTRKLIAQHLGIAA